MTAAALRRDDNLIEGEYAFTARDFQTISDLLYRDSGIHLPPAKATLVYSRLAKRLRSLQLASFTEYCALLTGPDGAGERSKLLSALTTNVTRFFREAHHFDRLRSQVREHLAPAARAGGRVRLWSAGCSLGHEPYSIAMALLAELPDAPDLDVRILATDIDPQVIERARRGEYSLDDVQPVPAEMARRSLSVDGASVRIAEPLKRLISFGVLNLHADWPMRGKFDAIFCRNVAIYFDDQTQHRLWNRFAERLTPEGLLYIGHSERADTPTLTTDGMTVYRRAGR